MLVNPTVFLARSRNLNRSDNRTNFQIQFLVTYSSQRPWCWEPNPPLQRSLSLFLYRGSIDRPPLPRSRSGKHKNSRRDKKAFFFFLFFSFRLRHEIQIYIGTSVFHQGEGIYGNEASLSRTHGLIIQFFDRIFDFFSFFFPFSRLFLFSRVYNIILYRRIVGVCSTLPSFPRQERGSLSSSRNSRETFLLDREKKWKGKTERDSSTVTTPRIVGPADIGAYEA